MAFPTGWGRKCSVTIDNTKVSGSANHSDFPVLITEDNLPSEMFDADGSYPARSDGGDIRFTSDEDGTTELAREIVEFTTDNDPANATAQIWVKVPTLDYNDDTVIYVWYNAPSETEPASDATYGSEAVWSDYVGVFHMEEDPSGSSPQIVDSAGNGSGTSIGTMTSGDLISAKIQNGLDFDGSDDKIQIANENNYDLTSLSVQAWIKTTDNGAIVGKGKGNDYQWSLRVAGGKLEVVWFIQDGTSNYLSAVSSASVNDNNNHFVVGTFTETENKAYIDGSQDGFSDSTSGSRYTSGSAYAGIAGREDGNLLGGVIDEVRITSSILTSDWIATEYANQNTPADFASAGTPSSTTTTNIKSINGVAYADIKSINGVAIADVKSFNGLE